jgi:hypothetical protein
MHPYRCYLLDAGGTIREIAAVTAEHDALAVTAARNLLGERPWLSGFELWHRTRRIVVETPGRSSEILLVS